MKIDLYCDTFLELYKIANKSNDLKDQQEYLKKVFKRKQDRKEILDVYRDQINSMYDEVFKPNKNLNVDSKKLAEFIVRNGEFWDFLEQDPITNKKVITEYINRFNAENKKNIVYLFDHIDNEGNYQLKGGNNNNKKKSKSNKKIIRKSKSNKRMN